MYPASGEKPPRGGAVRLTTRKTSERVFLTPHPRGLRHAAATKRYVVQDKKRTRDNSSPVQDSDTRYTMKTVFMRGRGNDSVVRYPSRISEKEKRQDNNNEEFDPGSG